MTAYIVFIRDSVTDAQALEHYRTQATAARDAYPLEPLAYYGLFEVLEGTPVEGIAILGFPSLVAARAWYDSAEYQAALPHRLQGSTGRMYLVEGLRASPESGS